MASEGGLLGAADSHGDLEMGKVSVVFCVLYWYVMYVQCRTILMSFGTSKLFHVR